MAKNRIRLTESQLHRVINESVKKIIKEYAWNGRTPEQDSASIQAANKPTDWKAQMMKVQDNGWDKDAVDRANRSFSEKHGITNDYDEYDDNRGFSNQIRGTISRVAPSGGRLAFNQRNRGYNAERYHEKNYGDFDSQNLGYSDKDFNNGYVHTFQGGSRNLWGNKKDGSESLTNYEKESPMTNTQRVLPMSRNFRRKLVDMDVDMDDFYSGSYRDRMNFKKKQLGNRGQY